MDILLPDEPVSSWGIIEREQSTLAGDLMVIYVRPEVGQGGFQRALSCDVPLVGSEGLDEARIDVVVGGTPEEMDSGVFKWPDVPVPGVKVNGSVIRSVSDMDGISPVLGALLNACGDTVREGDLRAGQPRPMVTYPRNRRFGILFRGEATRTRGGQQSTRLA